MSAVFKAGHTALITGGASGIGLSLAKRCRGYGMKVLVADIDDELLAAMPKDADGDVDTFKMDVSKLDDWARLKSKVDQDFGGWY
jgi:NAD(P)-dependent dehydrogenase (short-subunit alcohol dehydrogenase family)